jgi:hypothetical protein
MGTPHLSTPDLLKTKFRVNKHLLLLTTTGDCREVGSGVNLRNPVGFYPP